MFLTILNLPIRLVKKKTWLWDHLLSKNMLFGPLYGFIDRTASEKTGNRVQQCAFFQDIEAFSSHVSGNKN